MPRHITSGVRCRKPVQQTKSALFRVLRQVPELATAFLRPMGLPSRQLILPTNRDPARVIKWPLQFPNTAPNFSHRHRRWINTLFTVAAQIARDECVQSANGNVWPVAVWTVIKPLRWDRSVATIAAMEATSSESWVRVNQSLFQGSANPVVFTANPGTLQWIRRARNRRRIPFIKHVVLIAIESPYDTNEINKPYNHLANWGYTDQWDATTSASGRIYLQKPLFHRHIPWDNFTLEGLLSALLTSGAQFDIATLFWVKYDPGAVQAAAAQPVAGLGVADPYYFGHDPRPQQNNQPLTAPRDAFDRAMQQLRRFETLSEINYVVHDSRNQNAGQELADQTGAKVYTYHLENLPQAGRFQPNAAFQPTADHLRGRLVRRKAARGR
ncbi:hypothetical protein FALBO_9463 [Fusarium albosuccineum]|uniref:Uncharacterized protein n=1 Tax=Fusarium albosuccineum TaxID=1237068 RepID=A0A8H4PAN2_9HYPO|nr:hypothetical protein FALBO_9463 [Fusarium albosuccineum]